MLREEHIYILEVVARSEKALRRKSNREEEYLLSISGSWAQSGNHDYFLEAERESAVS
jgi:hypothetical protein